MQSELVRLFPRENANIINVHIWSKKLVNNLVDWAEMLNFMYREKEHKMTPIQKAKVLGYGLLMALVMWLAMMVIAVVSQ
jgi:hypothetical protein